MLKAGDKAPEFSLQDGSGKVRKLSDYKGKWLLLYFYPKNFTSGCTKEACGFRDNFADLKKLVEIVGVSSDTVESHKKFSEKHEPPFTLLSDHDREAIKAYGATGFVFAKRVSFLINPKGIIEKVYDKVDAKSHATKILSDLNELLKQSL